MTTASPTDDFLWKNLKNGNKRAFSALFERYYPSLVSYSQSLMGNPEHAQDCVQDVFVDVWTYRQSLTEVDSVKAYLLSSVRKRAARLHERDRIFRQTSAVEESQFSIEFTVEDQLIADEETAAKVHQLNTLLNSLPARQREALYLRYHQGLSIDQLAELLQINYQTAVNLLHRAIKHLRRTGNLSLVILLLAAVAH